MMNRLGRGLARFSCVGASGLAVLVVSVTPTWAGAPIPAPLVGVTGPAGIVAAGLAYGGYLLFRRLRNRE
jgi:hypothetical protein